RAEVAGGGGGSPGRGAGGGWRRPPAPRPQRGGLRPPPRRGGGPGRPPPGQRGEAVGRGAPDGRGGRRAGARGRRGGGGGGVEQVLVFGSTGLTGFDPQTGDPMWHYAWGSQPTSQPSVQPTLVGDDQVVIGGATPGEGFRCVKVSNERGEWKAEEAWTTEEV